MYRLHISNITYIFRQL